MARDLRLKKIELVPYKAPVEKEECICCGIKFELQPLNFCIRGFYQGRRPAYVCLGCIADFKRRLILEADTYMLPKHSDVISILQKDGKPL